MRAIRRSALLKTLESAWFVRLKDLSGLLAGAPFNALLQALLLFGLVLFASGLLLYDRVGTAMQSEMEKRITVELSMLHDILEQHGKTELLLTIEHIKRSRAVGSRVAGLFDKNGQPLAGTLDTLPDVKGWSVQSITDSSTGDTAMFQLRVERWRDFTIAIGDDTRFISATLDALVAYLMLAGLIVTIVTLAIGLRLSFRTRSRLADMADALDRVSHGNMHARLPKGTGDKQIEHISVRMNGQLDELERLMDDTRNTIGNVAHDLRKPLGVASIRLQEVARSIDTKASTRALVDHALDELDKLGALFETILRIGRIRSNDRHKGFEKVDINALLTEIGETFRPVLEDHEQRLVSAVAVNPPLSVYADRQMIAQLLTNLITNAIRHCPARTIVSFGAERGKDQAVELFVMDNGPGIADADREKVLRPFFRLEASRGTTGSGLGLALVAAVASRHNATLLLEDAQPGLRVVFRFPVSPLSN